MTTDQTTDTPPAVPAVGPRLDRGVSRLLNKAKNICTPPLALPETMRYNEGTEASNPERQMFKVQYKSVLSGQWCESHLGNFSSQRRAANAAAKELATYETRVVSA